MLSTFVVVNEGFESNKNSIGNRNQMLRHSIERELARQYSEHGIIRWHGETVWWYNNYDNKNMVYRFL